MIPEIQSHMLWARDWEISLSNDIHIHPSSYLRHAWRSRIWDWLAKSFHLFDFSVRTFVIPNRITRSLAADYVLFQNTKPSLVLVTIAVFLPKVFRYNFVSSVIPVNLIYLLKICNDTLQKKCLQRDWSSLSQIDSHAVRSATFADVDPADWDGAVLDPHTWIWQSVAKQQHITSYFCSSGTYLN